MKHTIKPTLAIITIFILAQLTGLFVINHYHEKNLPDFFNIPIERPTTTPTATLALIITSIIIGTALIFILFRTKLTILWKAWYTIATALCLNITFNTIIPPQPSAVIATVFSIANIITFSPILHNIIEILLYGGLATLFTPLLTLPTATTLYIIIAIYDAYAVWKSKHMIHLAQLQTKTGIFTGPVYPYKPATTKNNKKNKTRIAILGGGDIIFPLMFSGVVQQAYSTQHALLTTTGATITLAILLFKGKKDSYYPAIPFLLTGSLIGLAIAMVL